MSKKNKAKKKLRKLIQQRLRESQSQSFYGKERGPKKETAQIIPQSSPKPLPVIKEKNLKQKSEEKNNHELIKIQPDFRKISFVVLILTILLIIIYIISIKSQFLNLIALKLFDLFQKS